MDFAEFEKSCAEYLINKYSTFGYDFFIKGGTDSTTPDIVVKKDGKEICNIEVKEPKAQCGQFVAFVNEKSKSFTYSKHNRPKEPSKESLAILKAMNYNFDALKNTSTKDLGLNKELYYKRIINYYYSYKKTKFFITRESVDSGEYIIFPTSSIHNYFDVTACYRKKKSGSHNPRKKEYDVLNNLANNRGWEIQKCGEYSYASINNAQENCFTLVEDVYKFQFKQPKDQQLYRVTVLSTTINPNIIFTISLRKGSKQKKEDLDEFESMLNKLQFN